MADAALPLSLQQNPRLERWVKFERGGKVRIYSGKVELGQGIVTAIAQLAAEELGVAPERIAPTVGDTRVSPDEWYTAGSQSMEVGGRAMALACAEVRELFLAAAAAALEVAPSDLRLVDGTFEVPGTDLRTTYWDLAAQVSLARDASGKAALLSTPRSVVGRALPRLDLPAKLSGGAFLHDIELPGMRHARVLRPPRLGAKLLSLDESAIRRAVPGVEIARNGSFVGLACEREEHAVSALEVATKAARWESLPPLPAPQEIPQFLQSLPSTTTLVHKKGTPGAVAKRFEATYSRPYIAHASMGPSCAAAAMQDGKLVVWSHTQGPHMLRGQLAKALRMPERDVEVIHRDGPGCYGHNGADDAALDAALVARAIGKPVLLQWTREQELACAPYGSAMAVKISAGTDAAGKIGEWRHELWSHTHIKRPGRGEGVNLLAAWEMEPAHPVPPPQDMPLPAGGGDRNAVPLYDFPHQEVAYHFIAEMPLRVSALRSLGAYANVFAIESMMDEIARALGADPAEFRLRHLSDPRARAVIEKLRTFFEKPKNESVGRGLGFSRYKNASAYCAVMVEIEVEEKIRLLRAVAAVDAGEAVNPDGLKNQVEGGIVQAASWTLKEAVKWDASGTLARTWEDYPILGFDEIPHVEVILMPSKEKPLGSGECAAGPTAA
ncbi:MAG: xanthine dehydrogenase family protein molybdopterin-binding subunit, partial [Betaproteobacteria bacterium]|nr:xanthine dehydrogenase family protein molybdopterin-binding subunit [Betaproteobacteria bacterium]